MGLSRAYYYCGHCRGGHCPWDRTLGLDGGRQSPAVQSLTALAGALEPFGRADDLLRRLAGLRLSASTCRRVTGGSGDDSRQQHRDGVPVRAERPVAWDFTLPDRDGASFPGTVAYLGLDAFAVPTRRGGGVDWRMLYVGLLYDPRKGHTVYLSDFDFEVVAGWMRRYATAYGLGGADTLVALTDGGNGLERVLRQAFLEAVVFVLDYYHAAERLHTFAGLLHGHDPGRRGRGPRRPRGCCGSRAARRCGSDCAGCGCRGRRARSCGRAYGACAGMWRRTCIEWTTRPTGCGAGTWAVDRRKRDVRCWEGG